MAGVLLPDSRELSNQNTGTSFGLGCLFHTIGIKVVVLNGQEKLSNHLLLVIVWNSLAEEIEEEKEAMQAHQAGKTVTKADGKTAEQVKPRNPTRFLEPSSK